jgi:hypothetical protein
MKCSYLFRPRKKDTDSLTSYGAVLSQGNSNFAFNPNDKATARKGK